MHRGASITPAFSYARGREEPIVEPDDDTESEDGERENEDARAEDVKPEDCTGAILPT